MRSTIKRGPRTLGLRRARRRDAVAAQIAQAAGYATQIQRYQKQIEDNFAAMAKSSILSMNPLARKDPPEAPDAGVAQLHTPKKPIPPGPPTRANVLRDGYHASCSASGASVEVKWRGLENGDAFAERAAQLIEFAAMPYASIPFPPKR